MSERLEAKRLWRGNANGFAYEIMHWGVNEYTPHGIWNYYVYIHEAQLRPADFEGVWLPVARMIERSNGALDPAYDEYSSVLSDAEFHCGITFYEKRACPDTQRRWVKVGCDYAHYWDDAHRALYNEAWLQTDAEHTCKLLSDLLRPLVQCCYSGAYIEPQYAVEHEGRLYAPGGLGSKSHYDFERRRAASPPPRSRNEDQRGGYRRD